MVASVDPLHKPSLVELGRLFGSVARDVNPEWAQVVRAELPGFGRITPSGGAVTPRDAFVRGSLVAIEFTYEQHGGNLAWVAAVTYARSQTSWPGTFSNGRVSMHRHFVGRLCSERETEGLIDALVATPELPLKALAPFRPVTCGEQSNPWWASIDAWDSLTAAIFAELQNAHLHRAA